MYNCQGCNIFYRKKSATHDIFEETGKTLDV